jgi:hypothetical protein
MTDQRLKVLFITHDTSNYGASRSLQLLLRNYQDVEADLIVQRRFFGNHDHEDLRRRFGGQVNRIWEAFLPFATCYQYGRKGIVFGVLIRLYNLTLARTGSRLVERVAAAGGYDVVHLNSLVLHSLISDRHPFVLHMRDVYDGTDPIAVGNVQKARGVIFIDEATRRPFRDVLLRRSLVLNNPFNMSRVAEFADYHPDLPGLDAARNTVFSTIGVANDKKGTGFIVGAFLKLKHPDARLLIVGGREAAALAAYRKLAQSDPRIIFWGEEPDIMKIYAISDYVLRGEEFPCVGRTVYEGLYSGCRVILPGDRDTPPPMFEYETYRDSIFFYRPRNEEELLGLLQRLTGDKVRERRLRSNVDAYVRSVHDFISSLRQEAPAARQEP